MVATPDIAPSLPPSLPEVTDAVANDVVSQGFRVVGVRRAYVYATPLTRDDRAVGALVVILDAAHLEGAAWNLWWSNALRFLALALVVSLIALVVVRSSVTQPMAKMSEWTKSLRAGRYVPPPDVPDANVFGPLAREVAGLARSMQRARAAAEQEAALRLVGESIWTEERLKQFVNLRLAGRPLVVVSNREPVSHVRKGGRIQTLTPASGLVTAMDPMMRACGGVWVAHGSGDADRETADARGRLGPTRVWRSSGTSRGRTPRPSRSAPGSRSCSPGCSAPTSSASTRSTTATTSSRRSTARSRRGLTGSASRSPAASA